MKRAKIFGKRKRGNAVTDALPWIIISLIVFALILIGISIMKGTGFSLIDKARSLFGGIGG